MAKTTEKRRYARRDLPLKTTLSVACSACLFLHEGFYPNCPTLNHVLYVFCHANIFHLLVNLIVLWGIKNNIDTLSSFVVAIAVSYFPMYVTGPTMGLSGFLFAAFGLMWGKTGRAKDAAKTVMPFVLGTMIFPNVNGLLHLYCFWLGFMIGFLRGKIKATVHHE